MAEGSEAFTGTTEALAQTEAQASLQTFWARVSEEISSSRPDFKNQELPLARIKKIMKLDEDVKMISAEAPLLFAKAAEIFISELSLRAWIHTEDNKRRTLQRNDIAMAVSKFDQFDFLIDIVPREETKPAKRDGAIQQSQFTSDQVQYYFQLPQQTAQGAQPIQLIAAPAPATAATAGAQQVHGAQIIQLQQPVTTGAHQVTQQHAIQAGSHVFQPIVNGEVPSIPIQLSAAQLQALQMQMGSKQPGQPIIIHTQTMQPAAGGGDVTVSQAAYAGQQQSIYIQQGNGGYLQQARTHEQHTAS